jgi:O-antigen/teichoic acid export membrane protein
VFFLFTLVAPFEAWFKITHLPSRECLLVVNLLMLNVLISQQVGIVRIPFRCTGLHSQGLMIVNLTTLLQLVAVITVASLGRGPAVLASAMVSVSLFGCLVMYLRGRRIMPWLNVGIRHADRAQFRIMLPPALSQTLLPLGNAASVQGTVMVISAILGPGAVVLFSTTRTMTRIVNQLTNVVESCFGPEFSLSITSGNFDVARRLHHRASQLATWMGVGASLLLIVAGPSIYKLWTRHELRLDYPVFYLLLLALVVNGTYTGSFAVPRSVNRHVKLGPVFVGVYAGSLVFVALGLKLFGLTGAAMAVVLAEIALFAAVVPLACRVAQDNFYKWAKATASLDFRWIFSKTRFGDIVPTTQAEANMMVETIDEEADLISDAS